MPEKFSFSCLLRNILFIRVALLDKRVGSAIVGRNPELRMPSMYVLQCLLEFIIKSKFMLKSPQAKVVSLVFKVDRVWVKYFMNSVACKSLKH